MENIMFNREDYEETPSVVLKREKDTLYFYTSKSDPNASIVLVEDNEPLDMTSIFQEAMDNERLMK